MKIAVASDIHSNHFGLEAFLAAVRQDNIDTILFLGDYVSGASCPDRTMALLRGAMEEFRCEFVRGNRESIMIRQRRKSPDGSDLSGIGGAFLYTYKRLAPEDFSWFETLPISKTVQLPELPPIDICHGSMDVDNKAILPESETIEEAVASMKSDLLLCGHSHRSFVYKKSGKTVLNPGTLGWSNQAHYAIIEYKDGAWESELKAVAYDTSAAILEMRESGCLAEQGIWGHIMNHIIKTGVDPIHELEAERNRLVAEYGHEHDDEWCWYTAAANLKIVD